MKKLQFLELLAFDYTDNHVHMYWYKFTVNN